MSCNWYGRSHQDVARVHEGSRLKRPLIQSIMLQRLLSPLYQLILRFFIVLFSETPAVSAFFREGFSYKLLSFNSRKGRHVALEKAYNIFDVRVINSYLQLF